MDLESKQAIMNEKLTQAENNLELKEAKLLRSYEENEERNIKLIKTVNDQTVELDRIRAQFEVIVREYKN